MWRTYGQNNRYTRMRMKTRTHSSVLHGKSGNVRRDHDERDKVREASELHGSKLVDEREVESKTICCSRGRSKAVVMTLEQLFVGRPHQQNREVLYTFLRPST